MSAIPLDQPAAFQRFLEGHVARQRADLERVSVEVANRGLAHAVKLTNEAKLVDVGHFKRSWKVVRLANGGAQLVNDAPHAGVLEYGRRAGKKMPPLAPLVLWCRRKMGLSEEEAKRAAFVIARKIAKDGTKPHRIMSKTRDAMAGFLITAVRRVAKQR